MAKEKKAIAKGKTRDGIDVLLWEDGLITDRVGRYTKGHKLPNDPESMRESWSEISLYNWVDIPKLVALAKKFKRSSAKTRNIRITGPGGQSFSTHVEDVISEAKAKGWLRDKPGRLRVGDRVYDKSDPNVVGTITRLEYDTVEGPEGRASIMLSKTHRSGSILNETGPIASEFRGRGSLLSVATRMLKKLPKKTARDAPGHVLEIIGTNLRHPGGPKYLVRVPDTKIRRGYDLVDVIMHYNGAVSANSANRSTSTPLKAIRFVRQHLGRT